MHLPFDSIRYSPNCSSNVNYFLFWRLMRSVVYMK